jgi:ribosomal protein S27E
MKKKTEKKKDIAMQIKCLHCLNEQYAMAVYGVSTRKEPCAWCGMTTLPMSQDEYNRKLHLKRMGL